MGGATVNDSEGLHWFMFALRNKTTIGNRIHAFTGRNLTQKNLDMVLGMSGLESPTITSVSYLGCMTKEEFNS